ncbi:MULTISPECIES: response regulator transcription factor [Desulfosporosinus]|uniref:Stage 0 sporulation protein A homolog n=1 Tax=Desulfosporosinus acididurans TaxID=476652 RepID=A0A0J1FKT5_9FIRM|nr:MULTISPECIES: response regulator transcription factor [Desulfosporosinus]KLU64099.1 response regulator ArlR [Desulfosporosinus acididurans]
MANILTVDDDQGVLVLLRNILCKDGHTVVTVNEPKKIFDLQLGRFNLILLDVMMPGVDGFVLCRRIRERVDCPILFLTAKSMEGDVMTGLSEGADDYLLKPFGAGELRARISAHLRRESRPKHNMLCLDAISFDLSGKTVMVDDQSVPLTKGEYDICEFLACNRGQVFSKEKIYETVFGFDAVGESSAVVEHIKNIRAKFSSEKVSPIETIWGIGYRWR